MHWITVSFGREERDQKCVYQRYRQKDKVRPIAGTWQIGSWALDMKMASTLNHNSALMILSHLGSTLCMKLEASF